MLHPPFKLLSSARPVDAANGRPALFNAASCCEPAEDSERSKGGEDSAPGGRVRLSDLDTNYYCSVIGTCLTTDELRKLVARFGDVAGASDLEVHHEAVRLAAQGTAAIKALQKALDHRHAPALQRLSKIHDAAALTASWEDALRQGDIPGAYWAVLMHRKATAELRQRAFGDVHMLSHLVGAANRADIRRLVALEHDNAELRERLDRHLLRSQELVEERDKTIASQKQALIEAGNARGAMLPPEATDLAHAMRARAEEGERAAALIAVQTGRRERAEQAAVAAVAEANRLEEELEHLRAHAIALGRELAAAEAQLKLHASEAVPSGATISTASCKAGASSTWAAGPARCPPSAISCTATAASSGATAGGSKTGHGPAGLGRVLGPGGGLSGRLHRPRVGRQPQACLRAPAGALRAVAQRRHRLLRGGLLQATGRCGDGAPVQPPTASICPRQRLRRRLPIGFMGSLGAHPHPKEHAMKISARNVLSGKVISIVRGPVTTEVTLEIAPGVQIVSTITSSSAAIAASLAEGARPTR
jgi:molybdopterin-binding protein